MVINFNMLLQEAKSFFLPLYAKHFQIVVSKPYVYRYFFSEGLFNDLVRFGLVPVPTVSFEGFSNGARLLVDTGLPTPDVELQCPLHS